MSIAEREQDAAWERFVEQARINHERDHDQLAEMDYSGCFWCHRDLDEAMNRLAKREDPQDEGFVVALRQELAAMRGES